MAKVKALEIAKCKLPICNFPDLWFSSRPLALLISLAIASRHATLTSS
jgi:hypothetical protein